MSYFQIIIFASISLGLGIGPLLIYSSWKFGFNKNAWFSCFLGGFFWFLAFISRYYLLIIINTSFLIFWMKILLAALLAAVFETTFRVVLMYFLKKYTASSKNRLIMMGIGWGLAEAILLHSISMINLTIRSFIQDPSLNELFGFENFLLFGAYERILAEMFHIFLTILTFYGLKEIINTSKSKPLVDNAFTRYPKKSWLWIPIIVLIHFIFDFSIVILSYIVDLLTIYIIFTICILILYSYIYNRTTYYPLFFVD